MEQTRYTNYKTTMVFNTQKIGSLGEWYVVMIAGLTCEKTQVSGCEKRATETLRMYVVSLGLCIALVKTTHASAIARIREMLHGNPCTR